MMLLQGAQERKTYQISIHLNGALLQNMVPYMRGPKQMSLLLVWHFNEPQHFELLNLKVSYMHTAKSLVQLTGYQT